MDQPHLPKLTLPPDMNYIGVFLTFGCNLACSYCINDPEQVGARDSLAHGEMSPAHWIRALSRLTLPEDITITLQGGEPSLYGRGLGIGRIAAGVDAKFDLLTNLALPPHRMKMAFGDAVNRFRRSAPYPSIRVSYHVDEMNRAWGDGLKALLDRCEAMADYGFTVGPDKRTSDVGIYMVAHPENLPHLDRARELAEGRVAFETKEFLGAHEGKLYGTYKYPFSIDLVQNGHWPNSLVAECRTSELLIDPLGFVWPCHQHLYESWMQIKPKELFADLEKRDFRFTREDQLRLPLPALGHILDPDFSLDTLRGFHPCNQYGLCIGCDTKVKNNRFQSLQDQGRGHTSVDIRNIEMPAGLRAKLNADEVKHYIADGILAADPVPAE